MGDNSSSNKSKSISLSSSVLGYGIHHLEFYAIDRANNRSSSNITSIQFTIHKVFNVKDYNAKGDGITDDTQAIRNAIEQARQWSVSNNNKPVVVFFPTGIYKIKNLKLYSNMTLMGEGIDKTKLVRFVDRSAPYTTYTGTGAEANITITTNLFNSGTFITIPSPMPSDHPSAGHSTWAKSFIGNYDRRNGNTNIGIYNMTINGSGYEFTIDPNRHTQVGYRYAESSNNYCVSLYRCSNITVDNVRIEDSMNWSFSCEDCQYIRIGYLEINGNTQFGMGRVSDRLNQDGANFKYSRHIFIDKLIVKEAYDSALALEVVNKPIAVHDVNINYVEIHRHIRDGSAVGIACGSAEGGDVHDVYIKHIKIIARNREIIPSTTLERGSHTSHFVDIGYEFYPEYRGIEGKGKAYNIRIDKIEVVGFSHRILPYDFQTGNARTKEAGIPILAINSRPKELYYDPNNPANSAWNINKVSNVTIGEVIVDYQMQGYTGAEFGGQFGLTITGAENIRIGKFHSINKSSRGISDVRIFYSNDIRIDELYIRRVDSGGAALITVNNSQRITLDNVTIPNAADGQLQGNAALRVEYDSRDILLRYIELQTRQRVNFVEVPESNKQTVILQQI